ncbi:hypothetical protein SAMN05444004_10477 [Jannaschia faecimaris]|uniref:SnoaL-like domain-containing protein n=1 Tax=Jannaschia faecimaris TaxID=1244108 RepID=A0A1H3NRE9_9RHOB|nr:hypothetical protein [Jannaschia faecimaris]SDY91368.1 hypothetical protein SAMN05444004_10477 [Jannaschia faecimaris]
MTTALGLYQDHLDLVSRHIWNRDFHALTKVMAYPHELITGEGLVAVDNAETLKNWAIKFRDRLEELGATAYHRVAIAAAFTGNAEDRIDGFHRVYVLDGATHLIDPYSSEACLVLKDDVWLGAGVRATLRTARYVVDEDQDT